MFSNSRTRAGWPCHCCLARGIAEFGQDGLQGGEIVPGRIQERRIGRGGRFRLGGKKVQAGGRNAQDEESQETRRQP